MQSEQSAETGVSRQVGINEAIEARNKKIEVFLIDAFMD